MSKKPSSKTLSDRTSEILGALIPSCGDGLRLVELGQKRPLKLRERFALLYNSPLCLHCNCNRQKFNKERAKFREIDQQRREDNNAEK
ncbi:MAG: hypothetical protein ACI91V_000897 [Lentimonas sp.]|jgi:hypothetical protein